MNQIERTTRDLTRAVERLSELTEDVPEHQPLMPLGTGSRSTSRVKLPLGDGSITQCRCGQVTLHVPAWFGSFACPGCGEGA